MFLIVGGVFLILLSLTLIILWKHEGIALKKAIPLAKVEELWSGEERRQYLRLKHELEVEYSVEKKPRLKNGNSVNISKGGMKLVLDQKLPAGAIIDLRMQTPEKKDKIELEAEIVWTKDIDGTDPSGKRLFHSGVKFIGINEPFGSRLSEYIASLHG